MEEKLKGSKSGVSFAYENHGDNRNQYAEKIAGRVIAKREQTIVDGQFLEIAASMRPAILP